VFKRILIANRGEIALRILRAAREMGIETVCVYSEADRNGPWLAHADRTVCIGGPPASESYLRMDRIIAAAEVTHAEAIHPGYGFLSENHHFAEVCRDCNIEFIGPSPEAMAMLGDKVSAKRIAREAGTPVFPGSEGAIEEEDEAVEAAEEIGYPVIVKAAAGGGGRGMRIVHSRNELRAALASAGQEAAAAFGNGAVYVEKYLERARHVEIQCLGDKHGGAIHLFGRDCSSQRRHQKLIEEAPIPNVSRSKAEEVAASAAELIRRAKYAGAATVEFLLDENHDFFMLEVNTRVQVEHPVTEMITGVDIVKEQIRIAAGEPLSIAQHDVRVNGCAIECRINAEDPARNFAPQPGLLETFNPPGGFGVRIDTHARPGYRIPPNYDSMIGKLIVHAPTRAEAVARMKRALSEFEIAPIKTTIPLHQTLLDSRHFNEVDFDIKYVERLLAMKS